MAKNGQMRTILLCGGILLVVLFFLGVFKMKEGFDDTKATPTTRNTAKCTQFSSETDCNNMVHCYWNGTSCVQEKLNCSTITTQEECKLTGRCYWRDDKCNKDKK